MARTPRIPPAELTGPYAYVLKRVARRMMGGVPHALGVYWHNRRVLFDTMGLGRKAQKWSTLDANLKSYAHMAVSAKIGCSWCLDYAYFEAHNRGLDEAKASEVPRWRESPVFSVLERNVMEYAEAMSDTPPTVTDEMSARLLEQLGAAALVELTAFVAFSNSSTRGNVAMGIESQEFSKVCSVPLARPSAAVGVS